MQDQSLNPAVQYNTTVLRLPQTQPKNKNNIQKSDTMEKITVYRNTSYHRIIFKLPQYILSKYPTYFLLWRSENWFIQPYYLLEQKAEQLYSHWDTITDE